MKSKDKTITSIDPLKHKNIFSFFKAKFKATPAGMRLGAIAKHIKRYLRITKFFRYLHNAVLLIQTSAFFIIYATVFIVLIPIILLVLLILFILSLFRYRKYNKIFAEKADHSTFCIYFWEGKDDDLTSLISNISTKRQDNEISLIAYSGSFGHPILGVKQETDSIFHISMGYFYSLKRKVLDKNQEKTTYIN